MDFTSFWLDYKKLHPDITMGQFIDLLQPYVDAVAKESPSTPWWHHAPIAYSRLKTNQLENLRHARTNQE